MPATLTTLADLKQYLGVASEDEDDLLAGLIERVSAAIQRLTGRDLVETERRAERHSGDGGPWLRLRHYPLVRVARLSIGVRVAMRVANDSEVSGAFGAWVEVTPSAVELRLVSWPDAEADSLALAEHATVADLIGAINATGKGWGASLAVPACGAVPATDLLPTRGSLWARDAPAPLDAPAEPDNAWHAENPDAGVLYREAGFPRGVGNIVADYTAGFADVPGDLRHACVLWAAAVYNRLKDGGDGLRSESLGPLGQVFDHHAPPDAMRIIEARREVLA